MESSRPRGQILSRREIFKLTLTAAGVVLGLNSEPVFAQTDSPLISNNLFEIRGLIRDPKDGKKYMYDAFETHTNRRLTPLSLSQVDLSETPTNVSSLQPIIFIGMRANNEPELEWIKDALFTQVLLVAQEREGPPYEVTKLIKKAKQLGLRVTVLHKPNRTPSPEQLSSQIATLTEDLDDGDGAVLENKMDINWSEVSDEDSSNYPDNPIAARVANCSRVYMPSAFEEFQKRVPGIRITIGALNSPALYASALYHHLPPYIKSSPYVWAGGHAYNTPQEVRDTLEALGAVTGLPLDITELGIEAIVGTINRGQTDSVYMLDEGKFSPRVARIMIHQATDEPPKNMFGCFSPEGKPYGVLRQIQLWNILDQNNQILPPPAPTIVTTPISITTETPIPIPTQAPAIITPTVSQDIMPLIPLMPMYQDRAISPAELFDAESEIIKLRGDERTTKEIELVDYIAQNGEIGDFLALSSIQWGGRMRYFEGLFELWQSGRLLKKYNIDKIPFERLEFYARNGIDPLSAELHHLCKPWTSVILYQGQAIFERSFSAIYGDGINNVNVSGDATPEPPALALVDSWETGDGANFDPAEALRIDVRQNPRPYPSGFNVGKFYAYEQAVERDKVYPGTLDAFIKVVTNLANITGLDYLTYINNIPSSETVDLDEQQSPINLASEEEKYGLVAIKPIFRGLIPGQSRIFDPILSKFRTQFYYALNGFIGYSKDLTADVLAQRLVRAYPNWAGSFSLNWSEVPKLYRDRSDRFVNVSSEYPSLFGEPYLKIPANFLVLN